MSTLRIIFIFWAVVFLSSILIPLPQGYCQGLIEQDLRRENNELKACLKDSENHRAILENEKNDLSERIKKLNKLSQENSKLGAQLGKKEKELEGIRGKNAVEPKQALLSEGTNAQLKEEIALLEDSFKKERAKFYQELGTAYTKAKFFDLAIESYLQSLVFNPSNAKVHYNLGLLYKSAKDDTRKSLFYFKKYLKLKPDAENRRDVEYMMKMMEPELGDK